MAAALFFIIPCVTVGMTVYRCRLVYLLNEFGGRNKPVDSTASTAYRPIHHANHSYTIVPKTNVNQNEAQHVLCKIKDIF